MQQARSSWAEATGKVNRGHEDSENAKFMPEKETIEEWQDIESYKEYSLS